MRNLRDGESIDVPGSSGNTYTIKNVGGAYSCSCMAWRTQSTPVGQRTCKHIRRLRGDAAEDARIGGAAPAPKPAAKANPRSTPLPAAVSAMRMPTPQDAEVIVTEYLMSDDRFDGVRARLGDGQPVAVTAGFAGRDLVCPPPVGGIIAVRFQEVTATGVPFAPTYAGLRSDDALPLPLPPKPRP